MSRLHPGGSGRTRNVLVLLSGGLDSGVLLCHAHHLGRLKAAMFVYYGQPAYPEEIRAARALITHLGLPQTILHEVGFTPHGMEAMDAETGTRGPRVVPARNLVLCALAVNAALSLGCKQVWLGATFDDCMEYVDCRPTFQEHLDRLCNGLFQVRVKYPFQAMTKAQVVARGREIGAPIDVTWSCYRAHEGKPCGKCSSCHQRGLALRA